MVSAAQLILCIYFSNLGISIKNDSLKKEEKSVPTVHSLWVQDQQSEKSMGLFAFACIIKHSQKELR